MLDFISETLSTAIWPITAVVVLVILRKPLVSLVPKLETAELLGFKAKFAQQVQEVAASSGASVKIPRVGGPGEKHPPGFTDDPRFYVTSQNITVEAWLETSRATKGTQDLALSQPAAAVLSASRTLQIEIDNLHAVDLYVRSQDGGETADEQSSLEALIRQEVVPPTAADNIKTLLGIAREVRGGKVIAGEVASRYVYAATEIAFVLAALKKSLGDVSRYRPTPAAGIERDSTGA